MSSPLKEIIGDKVRELLRGKGHSGRIDDDDDLITSGLLDSMDVVRIVGFLEEKFRIDFSERGFRLSDFDRISDMVRLCSKLTHKS